METLYEINYQIEEILNNMVDFETGEINQDIAERLSELTMKKDEKIKNIVAYIVNEKSKLNELKLAKKRLEKRARVKGTHIDWLTAYLKSYVERGRKYEFSEGVISWRKSESVEVKDLDAIPTEYIKIAKTADKMALKKALKDGIAVDGVELKENLNMSVK